MGLAVKSVIFDYLCDYYYSIFNQPGEKMGKEKALILLSGLAFVASMVMSASLIMDIVSREKFGKCVNAYEEMGGDRILNALSENIHG